MHTRPVAADPGGGAMSKLKRMTAVLLLAVASSIWPMAASQAAYPERPVKWVIGFPAGSSADTGGRIIAEELGAILGQRIVIENKPGAASQTAAESVARAEPDGYTLFMSNNALVINATLKKGAVLDLNRDMTPIALLASLPNILVVANNVRATSVRELIALAKAEPDKLLFASSGHGSAPHLSGELFKSMAGVSLVHVPFAGSTQPAQELVAGRLHLMFSPAPIVLGLIEARSIRALGWSSTRRGALLADLPTVAEAGLPGFDTVIWFGLSGPPGLPAALRDQLATAAARALASDRVIAGFRPQGIEATSMGAAEFARYVTEETAKWADVVVKAGLVKPGP